MKKLIYSLPLLVLLFSISSCSKEGVSDTADQLGANKFVSPITNFDWNSYVNDHIEAKGNNSTVDVQTDAGDIVGSSTIHRNSTGYTVNFNAQNVTNLDPAGHAITLWCIHGTLTGGPAGMYRIGGNVVGNNGVINMSGRINEGSTKDLWAGAPLADGESDVAFLIAKSHGPMNPMYMPDQILTFDGGCEGDPDDAGPAGPCYEFIAAGHF